MSLILFLSPKKTKTPHTSLLPGSYANHNFFFILLFTCLALVVASMFLHYSRLQHYIQASTLHLDCIRQGWGQCEDLFIFFSSLQIFNLPLPMYFFGLWTLILLLAIPSRRNPEFSRAFQIPQNILFIITDLLNVTFLCLQLHVLFSFKKFSFIAINISLCGFVLSTLYSYNEWSSMSSWKKSLKTIFSTMDSNLLRQWISFKITALLIFSALFLFNTWQQQRFRLFTYQSKAHEKTLEQKTNIFYQKTKTNLIEIENVPFFGSPKAPVQIVMYHDFQCPSCFKAYAFLKLVEKKYSPLILVLEKNTIVFGQAKHRPTLFTSQELAQYAQVAHQFGKYFEFSEELYKSFYQNNNKKKQMVDETWMKNTFQKIGIQQSLQTIQSKLPATLQTIRLQEKELKNILLQRPTHQKQRLSVPCIFINGKIIGGYQPKLIDKIIREEIIQSQKLHYSK